MRHILLVIGVATLVVLFLMLAGFMFVTWGVDFSSLNSGDRAGLLCIFVMMEAVSLFAFTFILDDIR